MIRFRLFFRKKNKNEKKKQNLLFLSLSYEKKTMANWIFCSDRNILSVILMGIQRFSNQSIYSFHRKSSISMLSTLMIRASQQHFCHQKKDEEKKFLVVRLFILIYKILFQFNPTYTIHFSIFFSWVGSCIDTHTHIASTCTRSSHKWVWNKCKPIHTNRSFPLEQLIWLTNNTLCM
mgnify:CR=1 FL=1